jgi:hypothetical protein
MYTYNLEGCEILIRLEFTVKLHTCGQAADTAIVDKDINYPYIGNS